MQTQIDEKLVARQYNVPYHIKYMTHRDLYLFHIEQELKAVNIMALVL